MAAKDVDAMRRRMASVSNHLMPSTQKYYGPIGFSNCSSSMNDNFHKVHGQVPTHEPQWKIACDETGKEFTDIIYEKAVGEGIAKVCPNKIFDVSLRT